MRRKWLAQDMPGHVLPLIYSKRLSRGQHRYGVDAEWSVLDGGARWRNLANTINRRSAAAMLPYVKLLRPLGFYSARNARIARAVLATAIHNHTITQELIRR